LVGFAVYHLRGATHPLPQVVSDLFKIDFLPGVAVPFGNGM
jgi:hypothetical protein